MPDSRASKPAPDQRQKARRVLLDHQMADARELDQPGALHAPRHVGHRARYPVAIGTIGIAADQVEHSFDPLEARPGVTVAMGGEIAASTSGGEASVKSPPALGFSAAWQ